MIDKQYTVEWVLPEAKSIGEMSMAHLNTSHY